MDTTVEIVETYEESYPSGKRNFEMVKFMLTEKETIFVSGAVDIDEEKKSELILEARRQMHVRLTKAVDQMVEKAKQSGKLVMGK